MFLPVYQDMVNVNKSFLNFQIYMVSQLSLINALETR